MAKYYVINESWDNFNAFVSKNIHPQDGVAYVWNTKYEKIPGPIYICVEYQEIENIIRNQYPEMEETDFVVKFTGNSDRDLHIMGDYSIVPGGL